MTKEELEKLRLVAEEEEEQAEEGGEAAGSAAATRSASATKGSSNHALGGRVEGGGARAEEMPEEWSTDTLRTAIQNMCIRHNIAPLVLMKAWDRDGNGSLSQNEVSGSGATNAIGIISSAMALPWHYAPPLDPSPPLPAPLPSCYAVLRSS